MIISHKHRFIFIKTAKTAGTSIEVFLSRHCGDEDVLTPVFPHVESHVARNYKGLWNPLPELVGERLVGLRGTATALLRRERFFNHIPARLAKCRVPGAVWRDYYKFCVERNPWDKTLSHYHMVREGPKGTRTLDEYLDRGRFPLNYPRYTDAAGRLLVDRVVRYEALAEELGEVFGMLGIPFTGSLGVRAKGGYRTDRRHYREVFSDAQRAVIERAFAKEIAMHGYAF